MIDLVTIPFGVVILGMFIYGMYRVWMFGPNFLSGSKPASQGVIRPPDMHFAFEGPQIIHMQNLRLGKTSAWNCSNCGGTSLHTRCDYCGRAKE